MVQRAETVGTLVDVEELGPDSIRVRLLAKTRPLEQWKVARELRARLKVAFD